jgi:putative transposase
MRTPRDPIYAGHRYPAEIISYAVCLYFRFRLSLPMVEEMLAAHGISVTHETIRQWGLKFGREFANRIRRRAPRRGDKWDLDEVVVSLAGKKHWLWRAVDQEATQNLVHPAIEARRQSGSAWVPALTGTESSYRFRSSGRIICEPDSRRRKLA